MLGALGMFEFEVCPLFGELECTGLMLAFEVCLFVCLLDEPFFGGKGRLGHMFLLCLHRGRCLSKEGESVMAQPIRKRTYEHLLVVWTRDGTHVVVWNRYRTNMGRRKDYLSFITEIHLHET